LKKVFFATIFLFMFESNRIFSTGFFTIKCGDWVGEEQGPIQKESKNSSHHYFMLGIVYFH